MKINVSLSVVDKDMDSTLAVGSSVTVTDRDMELMRVWVIVPESELVQDSERVIVGDPIVSVHVSDSVVVIESDAVTINVLVNVNGKLSDFVKEPVSVVVKLGDGVPERVPNVSVSDIERDTVLVEESEKVAILPVRV